jgi:hypothetical protein
MLDGDELEFAQEASELFRDRALPQYWDGNTRLGREVARSIHAEGWVAWDIYLFYPPGVRWTDSGIPAPEVALAQASGVVIATKGALPAVGGRSRIPKRFADRVDVVGEQDNLEALLARGAEVFATRSAKR